MGFIEIRPLDLELCSIEGCTPPICAQPSFDAKVPLAHKELLYEDLLYESCQHSRSARLRQQAILLILGPLAARKSPFFMKFLIWGVPCWTLRQPELLQNKFIVTSRHSRIVRNQKCFEVMGGSLIFTHWVSSYAHFCGVNPTSVPNHPYSIS